MAWYDNSLSRRAPAHGAIGLDGQYRRGGEFEPFFIPRQLMPQVDEEDLVALLAFLTKRKTHISIRQVDPDDLLFHQHVFEDRVPAIDSADMNKPLLVSAEGYVLDGNHRATAHKRYGTRPVVFRLATDFTDSMKLLFSFPKTYTYSAGDAQ